MFWNNLLRENRVIWTGIILFLIFSSATYVLSDIPFGIIFNFCLYMTLISLFSVILVLCMRLILASTIIKKIIGIFLSFIGLFFLVLTIITITDIRILFYQGHPKIPTNVEWQEDLEYLSMQLKNTHPNIYYQVDEAIFNQEVTALKENIPNMNDIEIEAGLLKIIALLNDAHTFPNIYTFTMNWHIYPINFYFFEDGIHVTDAGRGYKHLIGSEIVKIGDTEIDEVYYRLKYFLGSENEYGSKDRSGLAIAEWLFAEGIISDMNKAKFTFKNRNGENFSINLKPVHYLPYFYWRGKLIEKEFSPAISNDRKNNYWFEFREDSNTLYFQFNKTIFQEDRPLTQFLEDLQNTVERNDFDRFVIDIRNNGGGDLGPIPLIFKFIFNNQKINQNGKLFVITGRKTFSGGVTFASLLRNNTKAIFVGEPTSQGPNFFCSPNQFILPNSKLPIMVSTRKALSSLTEDERKWIEPDIHTKYTSKDFMIGRDPAMEAILNYKYEPIITVKTNKDVLKKITGRYLYSPYQILSVVKDDRGLSFSISDFNNESMVRVHSDMYPISETEFETDIPFVKLKYFADELYFNWGKTEKVIKKVPVGFMLPMEYFQREEIEKGIALLNENKEENAKNIVRLEQNLNRLGYSYLVEGRFEDAINIFKLNVELFPESANVYDSLGEAYMKNGATQLALSNYRKSLDINSKNINATKMIDKLQSEM